MFKTILDYDGGKQGNPRLSDVFLVQDEPEGTGKNRKWHCNRPLKGAETTNYIDSLYATELILCKWFFILGTIEGVPGNEPKSSGARQVTCDALGRRVSVIMETRGQTLLHEYTHFQDMMTSVFGSDVKRTSDIAYGYADCRNLDKKLATKNADSYASFASELLWTTKCDRDFEPPLPPAQIPPRQKTADMLTHVGVEPTREQLMAAHTERVVDTLIRLGFDVKVPPVPDEVSSSDKESCLPDDADAAGGSTAKGGSAAKRNLAEKGASSVKAPRCTKGASRATAASSATGTPSAKGKPLAKGVSSAKGTPSAKGASSAKGTPSAKVASSANETPSAKGNPSAKGVSSAKAASATEGSTAKGVQR